MKRLFCITVILLLAAPAFAQDDLGAFGGLFGGDVGLSAPPVARGAAPAARGAAPARGNAPAAPAVDRLMQLRQALLNAKAPLTREQETSLNALLDVEVPVMQRAFQARLGELGVRPTPPAPTAPGTGPRGAPAAPVLDTKTEATLRRFIAGLNDQLLRKVTSAPALKPEQQAVLTKLHKDQIRGRGGLDAIQLALEEAGLPFTTEQMAQVQPIFDEQDQARLQADPAKTAQLEQATMLKVVRLLSPAQRAAMQAAAARPQP